MSSGNDWNKRNRDKATAATRRWRERNPGWQQRERETAWKRLYGLAPADFYALKREQGAQCAICEDENGGKELDVDHDHATGRVRGLLCRRCNIVLGMVDRVSIEKVVGYLAHPPAERFLDLAREE
ncbi:MAG TPA: endonuclease domain-containing protein [Gemmatimonadaceae bacterium]|nr:endonuclease domain-containing protein [Gemmatimonadaceae bacterium]